MQLTNELGSRFPRAMPEPSDLCRAQVQVVPSNSLVRVARDAR